MKCFIAFFLFFSSTCTIAQTAAGPWKDPSAIIIPDPYEGNKFDFDLALSDPKIRGVILRGAQGLTIDNKLRERADQARRRGIRFGIYTLGLSSKPYTDSKGRPRPGIDPIAQADLLVALGKETGATLLALDIEGLSTNFMSLEDAARFIEHVRNLTGRYPLFYSNGDVAGGVAKRYDSSSIFAKAPLWIAAPSGAFSGNRVWPRYALWQFGAEWDCPRPIRARKDRFTACKPYRRYPVAGSDFDLDVNLLNGGDDAFDALFGPAQTQPGPQVRR